MLLAAQQDRPSSSNHTAGQARWEAGRGREVTAGQEVPRIRSKNVGIENIAADSELADPGRMVDWHNWTQIRLESERAGPGEQGRPLVISKERVSESSH